MIKGFARRADKREVAQLDLAGDIMSCDRVCYQFIISGMILHNELSGLLYHVAQVRFGIEKEEVESW